MNVVNTSAYLFVPLTDLEELREQLLAYGHQYEIKGTILLSPEGVNCMLAAQADQMDRFKEKLAKYFTLPYKNSRSDYIPFQKFMIKIKPEIISFRQEGIEPLSYTSPHLDPKVLQQWLDEGREVVLLDTRNRFELSYGKFKNAIDLGIDNFTDFPQAVARLPESYKHKTIVTYCTGGVRCEKAGPYLEAQGFTDVYQIDGGILNYFEQCGDAHYDGECFVFDERIALNAELAPTQETLL